MLKLPKIATAVLITATVSAIVALAVNKGNQNMANRQGTRPASDVEQLENYPKATFAAGCFWSVELNFSRTRGVLATQVGYTGGTTKNPSYRQVCTGRTGHAEAVQLRYDPNKISYEQLLEVFWIIHNPTTRNRQGPDIGTQYRSVIFYHTPRQRETAVKSKKILQQSGKLKANIVTLIKPAGRFYLAEDYHQKYLQNRGIKSCTIKTPMPKIETTEDSNDEVVKSDAQWRKELSPLQYRVIRRKGTEPAFSGKYWNNKQKGIYKCVGCGNELFSSDTKFQSGSGWPSFWSPQKDENITEKSDRSFFMKRTEVICSRCDAHLGHLFKDGPKPTHLRYCINSAALDFEKEQQKDEDAKK